MYPWRAMEFGVVEQQQMMAGLSDQQRMMFQSQYLAERKDPTIVIVLAVLFGYLGVDRFILGDIGMGILKLLTGGLCGILWLIDIFTASSKTHDYNRRKAMEILAAVRMTTP